MTQTLEAIFDGEVIYPSEPLALEPNPRVCIVVETLPDADAKPTSFLRAARSLQPNGPADWSTHLDEHLYGEEAQRGA